MKISILPIFVLLFSCSKKVTTIKPIVKKITESVYASGNIKSQNQYKVFSTVSGIVEAVLVVENETVNIGTPLFVLANESQQLLEKNAELSSNFNALNFNKGKLQEAQLLVSLAKQKMGSDELMYSRQKNLWNEGIGSKVELELKQLAFSNAKVSYTSALQKYNDLNKQIIFLSQQAQNNLQISNKNTNDFIVKSTINGKVFQINTTKGELVTPQAPLAIIGDNKLYILEMLVDEYDIVSIQLGMHVFVVLNSYKDSVFSATVTKINPFMNVQSRTFNIEALFTKPPILLYPAISFEANILIKSKLNALLIPRTYLKNDSIVVLSSGKERIVKTGIKDFEMIEILFGIDKNDQLILPPK